MVVSHPDTVGLSDVTLKHSPHYDRGLTQAYLRVKCLRSVFIFLQEKFVIKPVNIKVHSVLELIP